MQVQQCSLALLGQDYPPQGRQSVQARWALGDLVDLLAASVGDAWWADEWIPSIWPWLSPGLAPSSPDLVVEAVESMSRRLNQPKQSPVQLAELMTRGHHLPRFGAALRDLLA